MEKAYPESVDQQRSFRHSLFEISIVVHITSDEVVDLYSFLLYNSKNMTYASQWFYILCRRVI